jgi:hypothetical protein
MKSGVYHKKHYRLGVHDKTPFKKGEEGHPSIARGQGQRDLHGKSNLPLGEHFRRAVGVSPLQLKITAILL